MIEIPVTIYTTPNCVQCNATKREFDRHEIEYEVIDLTQHPDLADTFKERGFTQAPIVTTDTKTWSGFRREKILSLVQHIKSLKAHHQEPQEQSDFITHDYEQGWKDAIGSVLVTLQNRHTGYSNSFSNLVPDSTYGRLREIEDIIELIKGEQK